MKQRITFLVLVTLAASLAHYLIVLAVAQIVVFGGGAASAMFVPVLRLLTAPANILLSSSFGQALSPMPLQILFITNSLLWGFVVGMVFLWRRLRYE